MKTILKYLLAGRYFEEPPIKIAGELYFRLSKIIIVVVLILFTFQSGFSQRDVSNLQPEGMFYVNLGVDNIFISHQTIDQWTKMNFNLVEKGNPNFFIDLGSIYKTFDIGVSISSNGSGFSTAEAYTGRRLTSPKSPISSWLNLEFGQVYGSFTNIRPLNYVPTPDQAGQQLELHYTSYYWGLETKNYLNWLHYNAPSFGHKKIPVNTGFFVSVDYQPYGREWSEGYYDQDIVFTAVTIKTIPVPGKIHGTAGFFLRVLISNLSNRNFNV